MRKRGKLDRGITEIVEPKSLMLPAHLLRKIDGQLILTIRISW